MNRLFPWMLTIAVTWISSAGAEPWRELGMGTSTVINADGKPWFTVVKKRRTENGRIESEMTFQNSLREPLSIETYTTTANGELVSYHWSQKQLGRDAQIDVTAQRLKIRYQASATSQANEKVFDIDAEERTMLIVPPMIDERILKNWEQLKSGKKIEFLVIVPDRQDYFRFRFTPEHPKYLGGYSFMLRAASFFLSLAVAPIAFHFTADPALERIEDIPPPIKRLNINGEWENTKTDILFRKNEKK